MSLTNVVNTTYPSTQISYGTATTLGTEYTYTEDAVLPIVGTATVTSYNAATNAISVAIVSATGITTITGTVVANSTNSFLVQGTLSGAGIATPIGGFQYITNTATGQPGLLRSVSVPAESVGIVYTPACYCRGTMIRTPNGLRAVEDLVQGDLVNCVLGGTSPVLWVGRRSYGGRFLRANPELRPVRFREGSLGPSLPARDLLVSRRHSMLIDGVLVPAELLVNGATIVVDEGGDTVEYFHIELSSHDAVWAEDVPSETFVDDGSRGVFHNAGSAPGTPVAEPMFCAPRIEHGAILDSIRARLAAIAGLRRAA